MEFAEDSEREEEGTEASSTDNKYELVPLVCFKNLFKASDISDLMQAFGTRITPLSVIGMFLNYAGNHMLHYIYNVIKRKIFYPGH